MFVSKYVAHQPDEKGFVTYTPEENAVWKTLYERQMKIITGRACDEFMSGIHALDLEAEHIPQLPLLNARLKSLTGWQVSPVSALIPARDFFLLLAKRHFPAATFIRTHEELDYVQEPDIFHELFGHCPMLTNAVFADFVNQYACKVLAFPESDWPLLQRLFWFTVEFGLIKTDAGLRAYGGGILSSIKETPYCIESDTPMRVLFNPITVFRTPYRIDRLQTVYFVIDNYQALYDFVLQDIRALMNRAKELGEFPPLFSIEAMTPSVHIHTC